MTDHPDQPTPKRKRRRAATPPGHIAVAPASVGQGVQMDAAAAAPVKRRSPSKRKAKAHEPPASAATTESSAVAGPTASKIVSAAAVVPADAAHRDAETADTAETNIGAAPSEFFAHTPKNEEMALPSAENLASAASTEPLTPESMAISHPSADAGMIDTGAERVDSDASEATMAAQHVDSDASAIEVVGIQEAGLEHANLEHANLEHARSEFADSEHAASEDAASGHATSADIGDQGVGSEGAVGEDRPIAEHSAITENDRGGPPAAPPSEPPHDPHHRHGWVYLAMAVFVLALLFGTWGVWTTWFAGDDGDVQDVASLNKGNERLRQEVSTLRRSDQISRDANRDLQRTLAERDEEIAGLRADVAFYESFVGATGQRRGLSVHDLEMQLQSGEAWHFIATLTQNLNRGAVNTGRLTLSVEGTRNDRLERLPWTRLRQQNNAPGTPYSFKYFQQLEGDVILPKDFKPVRVIVRLVPAGGNAVEQSFTWAETMNHSPVQ
jgi:hypothetical protein